jgi:hypothetical protein
MTAANAFLSLRSSLPYNIQPMPVALDIDIYRYLSPFVQWRTEGGGVVWGGSNPLPENPKF